MNLEWFSLRRFNFIWDVTIPGQGKGVCPRAGNEVVQGGGGGGGAREVEGGGRDEEVENGRRN